VKSRHFTPYNESVCLLTYN